MSLDINLTNVQSKPIVVSANQTAENDRVYNVIANATFTDPTGVNGKGYFVVVRSGASVVLGGNSYTAGETIYRIFNAGTWLNIALRPSTYESLTNKKTTLTDNSDTFYPTQKAVKTAVDLKVDVVAGKGLSENDFTNTLKTKLDGIEAGAEVNVNADWNATSGDAQILNKPTIPDTSDFVEKSDFTSHSILAKQSGASDPVAVSIGNNEILGRKSGGGSDIEGLSVSEVKSLLNYTASDVGAPSGSGSSTGTNTGDETQSTILSKLGFWQYNRVSESSAITNTTAQTIIENITIPANTYLSGGILRLYNVKFRKVGILSGFVLRVYIGPNANNLSGASQIAVLNIANTSLTSEILRTFTCFTNAIVGLGQSSSSATDTVANTLARTETSVDWTIEQNIIITVQTGVLSADSISLIGASAKNF
jgi:hypothetical protein